MKMTNLSFRPSLRALASLAIPALLLAGCTKPDPNKNKQLGPNVQLVLYPINGSSGPTNTSTPGGNSEYLLNLTDASAATSNGLIQWDRKDISPTYDWIVLVIPGDTSGITAVNINGAFWASCNQGVMPQPNFFPPSVKNGSSGGPPLPPSQIGYSVELTSKLAKSFSCQNPNGGNAFPGTSAGVWDISGQATNGRGITSNFDVEIQVGLAPLPNKGG